MQLSFVLAAKGMDIERIIILRSKLWPSDRMLPVEPVRSWIQEQHEHGIKVSLVRESELLSDPDLLVDFGIYGKRATGIQELDDDSHTLRFVLLFDHQSVLLAEDRWRRLSLYAKPYDAVLKASAQSAGTQPKPTS